MTEYTGPAYPNPSSSRKRRPLTEQAAASLFDRLRHLQGAVYKGKPFLLPDGAITRLDQLEQRLLHAIHRDNTGDPTPDGYPTGSVGSGGEDAAQSTTEAAALADYRTNRDGEGWWNTDHPDPLHALTEAAFDALERTVHAFDVLTEKLNAIDRLAQKPRTDPAGTCQACGRWVEGTAQDRLRAGYCMSDYQAWARAGRPDRAQFERDRAA